MKNNDGMYYNKKRHWFVWFGLITVLLLFIALFIPVKNDSGLKNTSSVQNTLDESVYSPEYELKTETVSDRVIGSDDLQHVPGRVSNNMDEGTEKNNHSIQEDINKPQYIPLSIESARDESTINNTAYFFSERISYLKTSMEESGIFFAERILDENSGTMAYILARNENYARNLNGYFYYLFDRHSPSLAISPLVLNISVLFDEEKRQEVFQRGDYYQEEYLNVLKSSLKAVLGEFYCDDAFGFIIEGYKKTFADRISGERSVASTHKFRKENLEIVFHDSFITYIEFYVINTIG